MRWQEKRKAYLRMINEMAGKEESKFKKRQVK
jgi:hypothetical protein